MQIINSDEEIDSEIGAGRGMQEKISALVDGELTGSCVDVALEMLRQPEQLARLEIYHQIRHIMRAGDAGLAMRPDFSANMMTVLRNL